MSESNASTSTEPQNQQKNNLQRIALKKHQLKTWQRNKKLEKLAVYSQCRADQHNCKCNGWKNPNNNPLTPQLNQLNVSQLTDPCRSCAHHLGYYHFLYLFFFFFLKFSFFELYFILI